MKRGENSDSKVPYKYTLIAFNPQLMQLFKFKRPYNILNNINTFIKKNERWIFIGLLIIGAFLRFSLLPYTEWFGDPARDLLVPQHILLYHEIPNLGHVASGTQPVFYYPPLYFYILAFIQIPSTNIWYILSVLVLMNIFGIGVFYSIVKRLSGIVSAVIATFLYVFSFYFLHNQTSITAYRFDLPIFLAGTLFHLIGIQKKQSRWIILGLFFLVVAASINYAILILIPVFLVWTIVYFRRHLEKPIYYFSFVYALFVVIYFNFARFIIKNYSWSTLFQPFLPQNNIKISANKFVPELIHQFSIITNNVFPIYTSFIMVIIATIVCLYLVKNHTKRFALFYPLSFLVLTLVLSAIKNPPESEGSYYFYSVTPFLFMIIGICSQYKKPYSICILSGLALIFLAWVTVRPVVDLYQQPKSFQIAESASTTIISELKQIQLQEQYPDMLFWRLRTISTYDAEWHMTTYVYFMEKKLGKLLHIYEHYNNLAWDGLEKYVVIVCMIDENTSLNWCKGDVLRLYPQAILVKQIPTVSLYPILLYKNQ
jgi:Dolichyl-phosphate-mannose-protein mannosyltransferase